MLHVDTTCNTQRIFTNWDFQSLFGKVNKNCNEYNELEDVSLEETLV